MVMENNKVNLSVLIVVVDYTPTTLRVVKLLLDLNFEVTIVASYNYKHIPSFFCRLKHPFFQKLYKRKQHVYNIIGKTDVAKLKVISGNWWSIWVKSIYNYKFKNIPISNTHRLYVIRNLQSQINYKNFNAVYLFDTFAFTFQELAKKIKLKNIFESRGPHFKYALEVNKKVNLLYKTDILDIDNYIRDNESEGWYTKLITEPKLADFMVFYSDFHRRMFISHSGISEEKSAVIPLAHKVDKSSEVIAVKDDVLKFVFVGNLSYIKGVPILIQAFKELCEQYDKSTDIKIELHLFGSMQIKEIEQMLLDSPAIFYHGVVENKKMIKKLKDFHVFVFPSLLDTYGFALVEALQMNLPVISNYTSGAAELYKENIHGIKYKDSYSVSELSNAMKQFVENPQLVEVFSTKIMQLNSFTEEYINEAYATEIEKLNKFLNES
jgi:glycosyltransferase involved in cell wall biosynthesis